MGRIRKAINVISDFVSDFFAAALALYCALLLIEVYSPGFVRFFFDIGVIAYIVFFSGIMAVILRA